MYLSGTPNPQTGQYDFSITKREAQIINDTVTGYVILSNNLKPLYAQVMTSVLELQHDDDEIVTQIPENLKKVFEAYGPNQ